MSPDEMGGPTAVIPSNDWWLDTAREVGGAVAAGIRARLVPAQGGNLSSNVEVKNIPIGQGGTNVAAASTPGGTIQLPGGFVVSPLVLVAGIVVALVGASLLLKAMK